MATSGMETEAGPEMPAPEKKTPWGKIIAVVIVLIVIIAAVAAWRLMTPTPTPTNVAPSITSVSADRGAADISQTVSFTASATDSDGDTLTYAWNFGDGATGSGATVSHAYAKGGNYIAVVSVNDGHNHTVQGLANAVFLLVNHPETRAPATPPPAGSTNPVAVISANQSIIRAGDAVSFNGNSSWTWAWDAAALEWAFNDASTNGSAITQLRWTWGDATTTSGNTNVAGKTSHTFANAGTYAVLLNVTNYLTKTDEVGYTVLVTAAAPPTGFVKNPNVFTDVLFGEPQSLDPAFDYETSGGNILQNVAEGLIFYDRQYADRFLPLLAVKVPDRANAADVSPDGMTYNFTLKSGVTFHSGNAVNCRAVEFSLERVMVLNDGQSPAWILDQSLTAYAVDNPATPTVDERLVAIQNSVTCPDGPTGLKVQFHLAIAYPAFIATMAYTVADVIDPAPSAYRVTSQCPSTDLSVNYCHDQLVSTGPFKLRVWQPNQQIILDANPSYHGAAARAVPFREVHIIKANDVATRVLMLKAGDADSISLPFNHKDDIRSGTTLLPGIAEYSGDTFVVQFMGFNQNINVTGAPPGDTDVPTTFFQDVNLRKAFSYAWQYTDFINNVVYGYGTPLCGPIPKGMFGYDATTPCYNTDLNQARSYMQQALDTRTPAPTDTYWDNGFTLTIYYNIGNTVREEGARLMKTTLEGFNAQRASLPPITIKVQGLEWASFLQNVNRKVAALFFLGWAPDYADPDDYVVPFLRTGQFYPNRVSYSNTTNDALIDQQSQELNPTTRLGLLKTIQAAPFYDVPYIWLYQAKTNDVFRTWVTGYYNNPMYSGNFYYVLDK